MTTDTEAAALIRTIADALNRLEGLDIDVQMPATLNAGGVRTDAGTLTFEYYDDGRQLAVIAWADDAWQLDTPAPSEVTPRA